MSDVLVVDGSHWVPLLNGHALAAEGVAGYIHKASDGAGNPDPTWTVCRDRALAAGLPVGAYHFYRFSSSPTANAAAFLRYMGDPGRLAIPPILDAEDTKASPRNKVNQAKDLLKFLEVIEQGTGRTPIVYTGRYWWAQYVDSLPEFGRYPLWVAAYPRNDSTPPDRLLPPRPFGSWDGHAMWQFTSGWRVKGMAAACDCSVVKADTFHALTRTTTTPAPPPVPTSGGFLSGLTDQQVLALYNAVMDAKASAKGAEIRSQACLDQLVAAGDSAGGSFAGDHKGAYLPRFREELANLHARAAGQDAATAAVRTELADLKGEVEAVAKDVALILGLLAPVAAKAKAQAEAANVDDGGASAVPRVL